MRRPPFRPGDLVLGKVDGYRGWHPGLVTNFREFLAHPSLVHKKRELARCEADPTGVLLVQFFRDDSFAFYDARDPRFLVSFADTEALKGCLDERALQRARRC
eukprot:RCo041397